MKECKTSYKFVPGQDLLISTKGSVAKTITKAAAIVSLVVQSSGYSFNVGGTGVQSIPAICILTSVGQTPMTLNINSNVGEIYVGGDVGQGTNLKINVASGKKVNKIKLDWLVADGTVNVKGNAPCPTSSGVGGLKITCN
jgi:hypothetical protein